MNMSESIRALRRANPRTNPVFAQAVDAAALAVGALVSAHAHPIRTRRFPVVRASATGAALAAAAAILALLVVDLNGGAPVEDAVAAVNKAAAVTAASAERSGTAVVEMTHDGEVWAAKTIRWHGRDLSVSTNKSEWKACVQRFGSARCGRVGSRFLLVDGTMYGTDAQDGGWVVLGSPDSIDPDSGTTPSETLAAVREDVGGATLERITAGMSGLTTTRLDDGSTVYSGRVPAGAIARETGFKDGASIRVLPFGYVAHDRAEDPAALLDAAVTVGADGVVRAIDVTWPGWSYTVSYSGLGETPAPAAPEGAKPLRR
jgi:hypothetical protein